jgi:hypothetical protein
MVDEYKEDLEVETRIGEDKILRSTIMLKVGIRISRFHSWCLRKILMKLMMILILNNHLNDLIQMTIQILKKFKKILKRRD